MCLFGSFVLFDRVSQCSPLSYRGVSDKKVDFSGEKLLPRALPTSSYPFCRSAFLPGVSEAFILFSLCCRAVSRRTRPPMPFFCYMKG